MAPQLSCTLNDSSPQAHQHNLIRTQGFAPPDESITQACKPPIPRRGWGRGGGGPRHAQIGSLTRLAKREGCQPNSQPNLLVLLLYCTVLYQSSSRNLNTCLPAPATRAYVPIFPYFFSFPLYSYGMYNLYFCAHRRLGGGGPRAGERACRNNTIISGDAGCTSGTVQCRE